MNASHTRRMRNNCDNSLLNARIYTLLGLRMMSDLSASHAKVVSISNWYYCLGNKRTQI